MSRIYELANKRILLLQGPVGPFFYRLAKLLKRLDSEVFKVNFHAGDWFYYPRDAFNYRGTMDDWPDWLKNQILSLKIDTLVMYGDCRPIHKQAKAVAQALGISLYVFEEGYVRPAYMTLEAQGVNAYSSFVFNPVRISKIPKYISAQSNHRGSKHAYWSMVGYGALYFLMGALFKGMYPKYQHHRPLSILDAAAWVRSAFRKYWYRFKERHCQKKLTDHHTKRYFLLPLQVFNDAQVLEHSDVGSVGAFITEVMRSFSKYADNQSMLVIKHHPMDRGYVDYSRLIGELTRALNLRGRVMYIHDQHLPSLLDHALGVVLINSTVGLSALHHGVPTKVCGACIYDVPGLTYQGSLDEFWRQAQAFKVDASLYDYFRHTLIERTQLAGSFYTADFLRLHHAQPTQGTVLESQND